MNTIRGSVLYEWVLFHISLKDGTHRLCATILAGLFLADVDNFDKLCLCVPLG